MAEAEGLVARDLGCRRGGRDVVSGVGFALARGDVLLVTGPNGAGKSSLLRVLAGYLAPSAGSLSWDGAAQSADPAGWRTRLHYVGHLNALKLSLDVRAMLRDAAGLAGADDAAVDAALEALDLGRLAAMEVRLLSAGQRRRLALARLVAAPRPLWLLDEPAAGLDTASRARLERLIGDHRDRGGIVIATSHGELAPSRPFILDLGA